MPGVFEALTFLVLSAQAGALGAGLAAVATAFAPALLSIGLSVLSSLLFAPKQPKPEDVQTSIRNPTAPRQRHYGRVKTSGPWVFCESEQGNLHKVIALGTGRLDAIEEFWIDDNLVTIDGAGVVQEDPWAFDDKVTIKYRLGLPTETHYSDLTSVFPEWTSDHDGHGVSSLYIKQKAVDAEHFGELFPKVAETLYRVVCRGSLIYNPSTGTTVWGDNAASVIRDYMSHADGMRLPASLFTTTQATAGWLAAYNRAAELVTLKAGGTEAAYRLWGSYQFNERPADVLGRMMQSCDARIVPTPDGGYTLDIGDWEEPTVVIDEDIITGFSEVSRGRDILTTANVISATFLSPDHDYQATDADRWIDEDDVALRGEIIQDTSFVMAPSHSQARRLMKLAAYRANPSWIGTFQCNLKALAVFGKRFVRITYPLFEIDEVFEVQDFRFNIGEGGILAGVTLQVSSMPSAAYAWNAATEEGTAPISEGVTVDRTIPEPTGFGVAIDRKIVAAQPVPYAVLSFDAPPSGLKVEAQGKRTADSQWTPIGVQTGATSAESFVLSDGEEYEFQIRNSSLTLRRSEWTDSIVITPVADETAPGIITALVASGGVGQVAHTWTAPNSPNYYAANIRRNTVNTEGTATLVHTEYGAASSPDSYTDTALAPGTYYYWLKARNASGVESASVATGAKTVT